MFKIEHSILVVIDVQGNLAQLMHEKEFLFNNINALIQAAKHFDIPIIHTEQVPEKIGETIPGIKNELAGLNPIIKKSFSCCGETLFDQALADTNRKEIIVCGIETHVCVVQTVQDLIKRGLSIQLVADAVSSRTELNKNLAIQRMKAMGADITSTEMLITELLRTSEHPNFKEILSLIKR